MRLANFGNQKSGVIAKVSALWI